MADTRNPGVAGPNPFETDPSGRGGDVRPVKVDMGMGPSSQARAPVHRPAARRGGSGAGTVLLSALLSVACGVGGAWAYEKYLAPSRSSTSADNAKEKPAAKAPDDGLRKELAGLEDRVKDLSERSKATADQYKQLRARVESLPTSTAPADLGAIEGKVAQVDRLAERVEALTNRVDPMAGRFDQMDRRLAQLDDRINNVRSTIPTSLHRPIGRDPQNSIASDDRTETANASDRSGPRESTASTPDANQAPDANPAPDANDPSLNEGETLFRQGKYSDAYAIFRGRLQEHPDDARNWYYAALSYGLATGEWERMTETMVQEGVAREKAGHPAKPQIDAAFDGLTRQTGKDWLAFYRRQAG